MKKKKCGLNCSNYKKLILHSFSFHIKYLAMSKDEIFKENLPTIADFTFLVKTSPLYLMTCWDGAFPRIKRYKG